MMLLNDQTDAPPRFAVAGERMTADEFETLTETDGFELIDFEIVEKRVDQLAAWVIASVICELRNYAKLTRAGAVYASDAAYKCFDTANFRKPDASFVVASRQPKGIGTGPLMITPDLAVEVISPSDMHGRILGKVELYLSAGVRMVWIIDPMHRFVNVYVPGQKKPLWLTEEDVLDGRDILPGFQCIVRELFPPVPATV